MLLKLPDRVNTSLAALSVDQNFLVFCDWLNDEVANLQRINANTKDEVIVRWQQGGIQALMDLTEKVGSSRKREYTKRNE